MQAIILAAGMGRRLGELTGDNTKCMLKVNGVRLIDRALDCLSSIGLSRIILVVGYKGDNVKEYVGNSYKGVDIVYVDNPIYDRTNNIYSLYLAKDWLLKEDTLLLESDLIYEPSVVEKIVSNPYPNLALVDKYESWMDGTVVTLDKESKIVNFLSKKQFKYSDIDQYYKTVNIYKFSQEFSTSYYVPFLKAYCAALGRNEYYEQVLKVITLLEDAPLKALLLSGEKWYEIDDIQDLDIASGMFVDDDTERWSAIARRYGGYWRYPHMLDFCYLVNPYFPPQNMIDEMKASFEVLMREYPSGMGVNSLLAAKNFSIKQDYVVVGNGAAELIKALMEHHVNRIGVIYPTFEEYPNRLHKDQIVSYIPSNPELHYTANDIQQFFIDKSIDTLLLINPDNPSGNYIPYAELLELIAWTKEQHIQFVVDESFVDFASDFPGNTLLKNEILEEYPQMVVVKSISKSFGVPGLRLGILASADKELVSLIRKDVSIWNLNSFAEFFMQIYSKHETDYMLAAGKFRTERERFWKELQSVPYLRVHPSEANYFLCEVLPPYTSNGLAVSLLDRHNILIKDCSTKKAFDGRNMIRLAVRGKEDNIRLIVALKQELK